MIDVLLIAEGTYPYIRGGVSTWIDELINGLPEINFGVIFLGGRREDYEGMQYEFPKNLIYFSEVFIFDFLKEKNISHKIRSNKDLIPKVKGLHEWLKKSLSNNEPFPEDLKNLDFYLNTLDLDYFLFSKESWNFLVDMYTQYGINIPFIDYFWTIRNMHLPLFSVVSVATKIPDFKILHSPSTGYAGFLGGLLSYNRRKPLIITEHGIYTRERKIDILTGEMIPDRRVFLYKNTGETEHIKEIWKDFFMNLGRLAYDQSTFIISLFEEARRLQILYGADPQKCRIIPNGIELKKFSSLLDKRPKGVPKIIGLIGRVVPIKDIKTFIKAIKIACSEIPEIEGWIVGPTEEDPDYYQECLKLTEVLDLKGKIKFTGHKDVTEILPQLGLITLTSISEGMPLVILEALASGVPCVTTDVGSCRQIIYGGIDEEDISIGKAGEIIPIGNPEKTAQSYLELLKNEELWKEYQKNGIERIKRYYTKEKFLNTYMNLYEEAINIGRY